MPRIALQRDFDGEDGAEAQVQVLVDGRIVILIDNGDEFWISASDAADISRAVLESQPSDPVLRRPSEPGDGKGGGEDSCVFPGGCFGCVNKCTAKPGGEGT
jgi:hypothetical protein